MKRLGTTKKMGSKQCMRFVPDKYKIRLGDTQVDLEEGVGNSFHTQPNTMLLKEPGLYWFLLRYKKDEAEPFMEWVVETVLPREIRKLPSAIEEKDSQIKTLEFRNEEHQHKSLKLNEEIDDLI